MFSLLAAPAAGRETPLAAHPCRGEKQTAAGFLTRDVSVSTFLSLPLPLWKVTLAAPGRAGETEEQERGRGGVGSSAHLVRPDPIIVTSPFSHTHAYTAPSLLAPHLPVDIVIRTV